MVKQLSMAMVMSVVVACGGGGKQEQTTPAADPGEAAPVTQPVNNPNMVSAEKMDEINRMLDRKQRIVARCLADAVDAKDLPKNARGRVTLEIVISPAGNPDKVAVINSTLESKMLTECVIGHVKSIKFPELPKPYPTSYTYAFEAM